MIQSKHDYYTKYNAGYFGNRLRVWSRAWEAAYSDCSLFMARSIKPGGNTISYLNKQGLQSINDLTHRISEQMPDEAIIIQGEYLPPDYLMYSTVKMPMKDAFARERIHMCNTYARFLIKERMCAPAREKFDELIDEHGQDHVIEFSIYDRPVGILGWNTIIWECRSY